MKKLLWFCLSLGVSGILFLLTIAACVVFSRNSEKTVGDAADEKQQNGFVVNVTVLFADETTDRIFATVLRLDGFDNSAKAIEIDCETPLENGKSLKQIYKYEGIYPLADSVKRNFCNDSLGFVKFNSKSFEIITDRFKNIVYNNENGGKMLLTGVEATRNLNSESFANYCEVLALGLLSSDVYKEYLFLTEICQSDLPYPLLYSVVRGN